MRLFDRCREQITEMGLVYRQQVVGIRAVCNTRTPIHVLTRPATACLVLLDEKDSESQWTSDCNDVIVDVDW